MADINLILDAARTFQAQANAAMFTTADNSAAIQKTYDEDAAMQRQNADSAELITSTQLVGQLQYEKSLQKNALDLGSDIGDASGIQAALAAQYVTSRAQQNVALQKITAKKSVSFFDDPLQFITNHLTLNDDIEAHNSAEASAELASKQIQDMNALTDARAIASKKLQTTVTDASVLAATQVAKNNALIVADQSARNALVTNSAALEKLVGLSKDQMQSAALVYDSQNKQEQIGIAQAHLALSQQEFDWKKQEKEKGDAVGTYVSGTIIAGYKAMYPNSPDKWIAPNSPKLLALISGKLPLDGEMKAAYDVGELNSRAANPDGSNRLLATDPASFLQLLKYGPQVGPDAKSVKDMIVQVGQAVQASPAYQSAVASKDSAGQVKLLNDGVKQALARAGTLVKDPSNPYYLPPVDQIVDQSPGLKDSNTYLQVIAPAALSGVDLSNPNMVLQLGLKAVADGKLRLNELAVDLGTIYKQGQRVNIQSKQFIPLGLAPEEAYRVKINTAGLTDTTVNMTNPSEILRAVIKTQMNETVFNQSQTFTP